MVMIDETEGIEFDSDGRGCSVTLLTEDGQSLRGLADRAGIWTELEERHPGLTPERILQGDHAVFGCIVIHDNLRAHGEFGMEFDGDAAFGRFELTDVELNMLGKKLPRLADTDELKAFFSHAGGGGDRLTQSERSTAYGPRTRRKHRLRHQRIPQRRVDGIPQRTVMDETRPLVR